MSENKMGKNVLWNTIGNVFYSGCQWLMTIVIVYLTADYTIIGNLGLSMTVTNSFTSIALFGMRNYQLSDVKKEFSNETYVLSRRITTISALVLCTIYTFVIRSTKAELICIILYMLLRVIEATEDVYQGFFQQKWRFDIIGKSCVMRGMTQICLFVLVFKCTHRLEYAFGAMVLSNFLILIFYDVRIARKIIPVKKISWDNRVFCLLRGCIGFVTYNFSFNYIITMIRVSLKQTVGGELFGVYSTIASPIVIIQLMVNVIFAPFIPFFAESYANKDIKRFNMYIKKAIILLVIGFVGMNLIGLLFGKIGLIILYNKKIASHIELLLPLIWCTFLAASAGLFAGILMAIRKVKYILWGITGALGICFVLKDFFAERWGLNGGSYLQACIESVLVLYMIFVLKRDLHKINM